MPDYGSPDGVEEAAEPLPETDEADGTPASLPTGGFADMGAGQARTVSDLARQVDDRPEVPELMDPPKTEVIDATDDYPAPEFAEVDDDPAIVENIASADDAEIPREQVEDWRAIENRKMALQMAMENNRNRGRAAPEVIEEAAMFVDFINHGTDV
ncbi:MAG: hypothetical protein AAGK93_00125 [Pseudomonadota bacterium]